MNAIRLPLYYLLHHINNVKLLKSFIYGQMKQYNIINLLLLDKPNNKMLVIKNNILWELPNNPLIFFLFKLIYSHNLVDYLLLIVNLG